MGIPCSSRRSGLDVLCNARVKTYPDGSKQVLVCDRPIFRPEGWENARESKVKALKPQKGKGGPQADQRAIRRARAQVKDLALSTPFKYFVTLTLDADKVDRYDMEVITKKLNRWCDNQVRRHGLAYILVPELHKDGAVHFHGFFNGALEAVDSGTISMPGGGKPRKPRSAAQRAQMLEDGGHVVYNLPAWSWGFTTAILLYGDYGGAVSYVCKYIGKDQGAPARGGQDGPDLVSSKIGGRWYYSGGKLGRPSLEYGHMFVRDAMNMERAYQFNVPEAFLSFVQFPLKKDSSFVESDLFQPWDIPVNCNVGMLKIHELTNSGLFNDPDDPWKTEDLQRFEGRRPLEFVQGAI